MDESVRFRLKARSTAAVKDNVSGPLVFGPYTVLLVQC